MRIACLMLLCIALASGADQVIGLNRFNIKLDKQVGEDVGVEFYLTRDGGASWQRVGDADIRRPAGDRPQFTFSTDRDGPVGFWTRLLPSEGASEPAPQPGDAPEIAYIIDTTAPAIALFSAALERTADDDLVLMATWEVSDPHLDPEPVQLQGLVHGGDWVDLGEPQPAGGRTRIPVPQERIRVRLVAVDQAGNQARSPATIPVVTGLPEKTAPSTDVQPADRTAEGPTEAGDQGTGNEALPSLDEMEAAVDGQLAETGPASDETEPAPDHDDRQVTPPRRSPQEVLAGLPPHLLYAWPDGDRSDLDEAALLAEAESILATRAGRLLFDDEAAVVLAAARVAARAGNFQRAGDCYARLHDSRLASESIPEEVVLHLRRGLPIRAATLARTAPPEARSPELQLAHAYVAFVDSPARAYRLLRSLPPDADCHLQAQILRARCLLAMEDSDREHAKLLLRNAARHQGRLGAHAQELLDLISGS